MGIFYQTIKMRLFLSLFIVAAFAQAAEEEKKTKAEKEIERAEKERLKQERKERKEDRKSKKTESDLKKTNIARTTGTDSDYFGITVDSEVPEEILQAERESKLSPEERVFHVTTMMDDWIERNAPNYFNRDRLEKMVKKIRQQYSGNIEQCRRHPVPELVGQRTLQLQDDNGILDRIIPKKLASESRKMTARTEGTPLGELDDINLRLTKLVKNQLRKCKKFKHFVHLRDIMLKNFARAFIRVSGYPSYNRQKKQLANSTGVEEPAQIQNSDYSNVDFLEDGIDFDEEDGIIDESFISYDYYERKLETGGKPEVEAESRPEVEEEEEESETGNRPEAITVLDYVLFTTPARFTTPTTAPTPPTTTTLGDTTKKVKNRATTERHGTKRQIMKERKLEPTDQPVTREGTHQNDDQNKDRE